MDIIEALSGFVMKPTLRDPARTPYFGSAQAPEPFVRDLARKRSEGGQCGHRRTTMEMPETELTATKRPVWNAQKNRGRKAGSETKADLVNPFLPQSAPPLARSGAV